ncbi:MAG: HEAT repeat domain-containing protein, partial [Pirellulales bacterium]|nr:HEAT repeat domain-containing protein [Pirellulales bacterium]
MNRAIFASLALTLLVGLAPRDCAGESPAEVSGRTIEQYTAKLNDDDRVVRLRALRSLAAFGEPAGQPMAGALDHQDAAMRYLAAVQLGQIGGKPLRLAAERLRQLADDKKSHAVRMAASYALCEAGQLDQHLPLLIESLSYPERGMACSAAELIGRLGPAAVKAT